jgi:membrane protein implicated in regulation of membrane protease activity
MGQSRWILFLAPGLVALHLNYWMWDEARLVLGLPANLLYHVVLSLVLSFVFVVLVRRAWPRYLDED